MPRLLALAVLCSLLVTGASAAAGTSAAALSPVEAGSDDGGSAPVVILGTAGLRWEDVTPETTPTLWELTGSSAVGSLVTRSVRTRSCPADGWLALGAGNRAGDELPSNGCRPLQEPGDGGAVPRWDVYVAERDGNTYGSSLGLLGDLLAEHGRTSLAIGPGAAVALAGSDGVVPRHARLDSLPGSFEQALGETDLIVVDLGTVSTQLEPDTGEEALGRQGGRAGEIAVVEERASLVLEMLAAAHPGAPLMLVSLADSGPEPRLQVLTMRDFPRVAAEPGRQLLRTGSTRQDGYVLATDLTPTVLEALDLAGHAPVGTLVGSIAGGRATSADRHAAMIDLDQHSAAIRSLTPSFFTLLIVVNLGLYALVWLRLLRPLRRRVIALGAFRVAGVVVGSLPVATFLANLLPWWRVDPPVVGLYASVIAAMALVIAVALGGPWRRSALGPLTVVAAVTAMTVILDVLTGSRLQLGSLMGVHPLVAGRFYGLNNSAFALLMVSSLLVAGVAGSALMARGRRAAAIGLIAVIGAVVTVVDGMPGLGSDFGGPPALVPAFTVLALVVARVRVSWGRMLLVLVAGVAVVASFAVADWLRPEPDRTHLGQFIQTVLDGGLLDVLLRKAGQNLTILTSSWLVLLAGAGVVLVIWLAGRPRRWADPHGPLGSGGVLAAAGADFSALRPVLIAIATGLTIGFAVNDSGIVIPAIGLSLAVPLIVATLAEWLRTRRLEETSAEEKAPTSA